MVELNHDNSSEGVQKKNHEDQMNIDDWTAFTLILDMQISPWRPSRICKLTDFQISAGWIILLISRYLEYFDSRHSQIQCITHDLLSQNTRSHTTHFCKVSRNNYSTNPPRGVQKKKMSKIG